MIVFEPSDINGYDAEFLISGLYLSFFGRAGEPSGFDYWYREIAFNGLSNLDAAALFASSPEFSLAYPDLPGTTLQSSQRFVDDLYGNVLERAPDPVGRAYWLEKVEQTEGNPSGLGLVVVQFIDAVRSPLNDFETMVRDFNTFGAKHLAAADFRALLKTANVDCAGSDGAINPDFLQIARDVVDEEVTGQTLNTHDSVQETIAFLKLIGVDPNLPDY